MTRIELHAKGPFSLTESANFLCGFTPASFCSHPEPRASTGSAPQEAASLRLGLLLEPEYRPLVVTLRQERTRVMGQCEAQVDATQLATQLARMLSLDCDGSGLELVAARDAVIGRALAERPGFRPVCFASAYEAAVWGVLSQRMPMRMAARTKRTLAEHAGSVLIDQGQEFALAPEPKRLLELGHVPGLPDLKLKRLQTLASAALSGQLLSERLRQLSRADALAELSLLPGVGAWTAELIRMRGMGVVDELTATEPRVFAAVGHAYGLGGAATTRELHEIAQGWQPYRSWICVLLVSRFMRSEEGLTPPTQHRPGRANKAHARGRVASNERGAA